VSFAVFEFSSVGAFGHFGPFLPKIAISGNFVSFFFGPFSGHFEVIFGNFSELRLGCVNLFEVL
jgi:hypothetical protein